MLLNGRSVKPSSPVRPGDRVAVTVPPSRPPALVAQALPLRIVYEDDHIVVVDKPAGPHGPPPAPGHPDGTLVNALLALVPGLPGIGGAQRPGIVHRLDRDTSGLIVVAKTDAAHAGLSRQLKERSVRKAYLALVIGDLRDGAGAIEEPIGRHPRHRKRMAVVRDGGARRSPTIGSWSGSTARTAGMRSWRRIPSPGGRTRSAFIWPTSAIRSWGIRSTAAARRSSRGTSCTHPVWRSRCRPTSGSDGRSRRRCRTTSQLRWPALRGAQPSPKSAARMNGSG